MSSKMTQKKKTTEERLGELLKEVGGRGFKKGKFPKEAEAINRFKEEQAGRGYMRLAAFAQQRELRKRKPELYVALQQWLWEAHFGKAKAAIEGKLDIPVRISFEVVKNPVEIEASKLITEGEIIESITDNSASTACATEAT